MSRTLQKMTVSRIFDENGSRLEPPMDQSWDDDTKVAWRAGLAEFDTDIGIRAVVHEGQAGYNLLVGRTSLVVNSVEQAFRLLADVTMGAREARPVVLAEVGRKLIEFSDTRSPKGPREAALWDAAHHVVGEMGDCDFRWPDRHARADLVAGVGSAGATR